MSSRLKVLFALVVAFIVSSLLLAGRLQQADSIHLLNVAAASLQNFAQHSIWTAAMLYFAIYVSLAALAVPGLFVLTMIGGAMFGTWFALPIVTLATAAGSLLSMLAARHWFRAALIQRWPKLVDRFSLGHDAGSAGLRLLALRLVPMIPYNYLNLAMAFDQIRPLPFFLATSVGMIPIHLIYTNAGSMIAEIRTIGDIVSLDIVGLLTGLALVGLSSLWWKHHRPKHDSIEAA